MAPHSQKDENQAGLASTSIVNNGGSDFEADDIADPKPKPSLSSYNMFFKLERKRILNNTDHLNLPLTNEEIRGIIAEHKVQGKRAHRKTHGKIGFKELARTIAGRWKKLDSTTKALLERHALVEKEEHRKIFKAWKKRQKERETIRARAQEAQGIAQANNNPAPPVQASAMAPPPPMIQASNMSQNANFNMSALLNHQQMNSNNQGMQQQDPVNRLDTLRQAHQQVEFEMKQLLAQAAAQQQQQLQQGNADPPFSGLQHQVQQVPQQQRGFHQAPPASNFPQLGGQQQQQAHPGNSMPFYGRVSPEDQFSRNFFDNDSGAHGTNTIKSMNGQQQQEIPHGEQQQGNLNQGRVSPEQARMLANALSQLLQPNTNGEQQQQQSFNFLQQQQPHQG